MSTRADFAYAAVYFVTQAGPLTLEIQFADATTAAHVVLIYTPTQKAVSFYEFNDSSTTAFEHTLSPQAWCTHSPPPNLEFLHTNGPLRTLLKDNLNFSDEYIKNLDDQGYRDRLEQHH